MSVKFPKPETYRSEAYLKFVSSLPCVISGNPGPNDPHHAGEGSRGMGLKADDLTAIPLAHKYHQEIHAIGRRSFEEKYHVNLWELIAKTQAEYIRETGL